jgi:DNA-binding FrmR family transcriptional regulator
MDIQKEKKDVLLRLRKIEGQIRGLQRMVEEGIPCQDILIQVAAATAALKKAGMTIMQTYLEECLNKSKKEPAARQKEVLEDFQKAMSRYIDYA